MSICRSLYLSISICLHISISVFLSLFIYLSISPFSPISPSLLPPPHSHLLMFVFLLYIIYYNVRLSAPTRTPNTRKTQNFAWRYIRTFLCIPIFISISISLKDNILSLLLLFTLNSPKRRISVFANFTIFISLRAKRCGAQVQHRCKLVSHSLQIIEMIIAPKSFTILFDI